MTVRGFYIVLFYSPHKAAMLVGLAFRCRQGEMDDTGTETVEQDRLK